MDTQACSECGKLVPIANMVLHKTRCVGPLQPCAMARSSSNELWEQNLQELLAEILQEFPEAQDEHHPAHTHFLQMREARAQLHWDVAFNELFTMRAVASEFADHALATTVLEGSASNHSSSVNLQDGPSHASILSPPCLDRSISANVAEAVGEPSKELTRRFLDEEGGDESLAMDRALLMHDLESSNDCQLELNTVPLECSICITDSSVRQALRLHPCGHGWYCMDCVQHYVDMKLDDGLTRSSLVCPAPTCGRPFSERVLQALLTRHQIERMHRRDLEAAVDAYENIRPCPTPDCPNRVVLEDGIEPRLLCSLCQKEHCLLCSATPFHSGMTCEEHLASIRNEGGETASAAEKALRQWMSEVGAKQCPTCRSVVTKQNLTAQATQSSECHKMICRSCRTKFCFGCCAVLTETFTCGCTPDSHGFLDPDTGAFVRHGARRELSHAEQSAPKRLAAPKRIAAHSPARGTPNAQRAPPRAKASSSPPPFRSSMPKRRPSPKARQTATQHR